MNSSQNSPTTRNLTFTCNISEIWTVLPLLKISTWYGRCSLQFWLDFVFPKLRHSVFVPDVTSGNDGNSRMSWKMESHSRMSLELGIRAGMASEGRRKFPGSNPIFPYVPNWRGPIPGCQFPGVPQRLKILWTPLMGWYIYGSKRFSRKHGIGELIPWRVVFAGEITERGGMWKIYEKHTAKKWLRLNYIVTNPKFLLTIHFTIKITFFSPRLEVRYFHLPSLFHMYFNRFLTLSVIYLFDPTYWFEFISKVKNTSANCREGCM